MGNKILLFCLLLGFGSENFVEAALKFNNTSSTIQLSGTSSLSIGTPLTVSGTLNVVNKTGTSLLATTTDIITFSNGIYQNSSIGGSLFNGTFNPTTQTLTFTGSTFISESGTTVAEPMAVSGSGNLISGQPSFSSAITMANSATQLTLGIQNKLNQNIALGGGTLTFADDVALQDNVFFTGNGIVNLANKTLRLPSTGGSNWSGSLTFLNANDIILGGTTALSGTWTFSGSGLSSRLNGTGNILDISSGGTIAIANGHTLYMANLHLKGLGSSGGSLTFTNTSCSLVLTNCTIAVAGNYTFSTGSITVNGSNCHVIAKDSDQFIVSSSNATLTVDRVILFFSPLGLGSPYISPIVTSSGGVISYLNGGLIVSDYGAGGYSNVSYSSASNTLTNSYVLGSTAQMTFVNSTPATPVAMTLDGGGNYIQFNYSTNQYMTLQQNITLTMQNILLKDFDPALINFQGAGGTLAKIVFGDNVTITLNKDITLSSTAIAATGNTTIIGQGSTLSVSATDMLTIGTASKTLTLKNLRIILSNATGIRSNNDTGKILLQGTTIHMTNTGMTYSRGLMDIKDNCVLEGLDQTTAGGASPTFTFNSKGTLQVLTGSTLMMDANTTLSYNPDISADGGSVAVQKRHIKLVDPSSTLRLNSATVTSGLMGLAFSFGKIYIDGRTSFNTSTAVGAEVEFGGALDIEILPGAILDVNGKAKYIFSTYP